MSLGGAVRLRRSPRPSAPKRFFATVQNKLHWAIHGQTAAEVIDRAQLSRLVNAYLDVAADMALRKLARRERRPSDLVRARPKRAEAVTACASLQRTARLALMHARCRLPL